MAAPALRLEGVSAVSTSASSGDYEDLDKMGFIQTGLTDSLAGRPVVVVVARNFVAKHADLDAVFKYVQHKCDSIVEAGPYSVVWYHTTAKYWENCPSLRWLWRTYEQLPSAYRTNLSKVFVVHPDFTLWVSMMCVCPWFTGAMWRKVEWISRVEFLWDYIDKRQLPIPKFVKEHDNILEESPLVDYGIVTDKDVAFQGMPAPH